VKLSAANCSIASKDERKKTGFSDYQIERLFKSWPCEKACPLLDQNKL
jgi:hypothetical protein